MHIIAFPWKIFFFFFNSVILIFLYQKLHQYLTNLLFITLDDITNINNEF